LAGCGPWPAGRDLQAASHALQAAAINTKNEKRKTMLAE